MCFVSPAKLDAMPVRTFSCIVMKYTTREYTLSENKVGFFK